MGLYKATVSRSLPDDASIINRGERRFVRIADRDGKRRELPLSKDGGSTATVGALVGQLSPSSDRRMKRVALGHCVPHGR